MYVYTGAKKCFGAQPAGLTSLHHRQYLALIELKQRFDLTYLWLFLVSGG